MTLTKAFKLNFFQQIKLINPCKKISELIDTENIIESKFCVNCKFHITADELLYSKCNLYQKFTKSAQINYLVTGQNSSEEIDYNYCTIARQFEDMCGKNGSKYIHNI